MSTPLASYRTAVELLTSASKGLYGGPEVSPASLDETYLSVQDLDTQELRIGGKVASGDSDGAVVGGLAGSIKELLFSVAGGTIAGVLWDIATDWIGNREDVKEIEDASKKAGDAIDATVNETSSGIEKMLKELLEVVTTIVGILKQTDPDEQPDLFSECVRHGAGLIDSGASMVQEICADRDKAICACYDRLLERGQQVCEKSAAEAPVATATSTQAPPVVATPATSTTTPPSQSGSVATSSAESSTPTAETPGSAQAVPPSTVPTEACPETKPAATVPGVPSEEPRSQSDNQSPEPSKNDEQRLESCAEHVDCEAEEEQGSCEQEACEPSPEIEETPEEEGNLGQIIVGAVGVALLAAGIGAIWQCVEQMIAETLLIPDLVPQAELTDASKPAAEPVPEAELAAVPEPAPKPIPAPEAELADVPEPAPKPIPTAEPNVAMAPAPAPDPAPQPTHAGEFHPAEPSVRKAGNW